MLNHRTISAIFLYGFLLIMVIISGCSGQSSPETQKSNTYAFQPFSQNVECFELSDVSSSSSATGVYGKIPDLRIVSGKIKNNCGKIRDAIITVRWYDENGNQKMVTNYGAYYMRPGDSIAFQCPAQQNAHFDGYIEETPKWTYKIAVSDRILSTKEF